VASDQGDARGSRGEPTPPKQLRLRRLDRPGAQAARVRQYVGRLSPEERLLVVLKRELYDGSWDDMIADLRARLEGRPFIFKLVTRITEDLERIARLRAYEQEHQVDLAQYVKMD